MLINPSAPARTGTGVVRGLAQLPCQNVSAPELRVEIDDGSFVVTVTVAGEVDLSTSTQLKRTFDVVLDRRPPPALIQADLRDVAFMDSSGVAVLLGVRARALDVGSRLVVTSVSPVLQRLFDVAGIGQLLGDQPSQSSFERAPRDADERVGRLVVGTCDFQHVLEARPRVTVRIVSSTTRKRGNHDVAGSACRVGGERPLPRWAIA